jgi:HK97 family phage major capsid protein
MSFKLKGLREQRAAVRAKLEGLAHKLRTEERAMTTEEKTAFDQLKTAWVSLGDQIKAVEVDMGLLSDLVDADNATPGTDGIDPTMQTNSIRAGLIPGKGDVSHLPRVRTQAERQQGLALALQGWMLRAHHLPIENRHVAAARAAGIDLTRRTIDIRIPRRPLQARALSHTGSEGGYTVPTGFVPSLESALKDYVALRNVADVLRTDDGRQMPWPNVDDTGNVGERIAENAEVSEQDAAFGTVTLGAYKYSSKLIRVPNELLEDSAINLADELGRMLGERIGRVQATDFTTGTGSSQPQGVVTGATLGKTAASATAFTPDELLDLIHSVDPAYRADPSFALMMSDAVLAYVRKMKDADGRPFFNDNTGGSAGTGPFTGSIYGVPVVVNQQMSAAFTTGQKLVLAGAFKKVKIRDVNAVRLRMLEERYAEFDQVGFIAFLRSDCRVIDAGTHPIKHLALA